MALTLTLLLREKENGLELPEFWVILFKSGIPAKHTF